MLQPLDYQMGLPCFLKLPQMAMALSFLLLIYNSYFSNSFFSSMLTLLAFLLSSSFQFLFSKIRQAQNSYSIEKPSDILEAHPVIPPKGEILEEIEPNEEGQGAFSFHEPLLELANSSLESKRLKREEPTWRQSMDNLISPQVVELEDLSHSPSGCSNCSTSDDDACHSTECSEVSLSDDENLIELALPDGHYIADKKPNALCKSLPDLRGGLFIQSLLPESVFKQCGQKELLSEINEEDNLIEIDIARGSIKCSSL